MKKLIALALVLLFASTADAATLAQIKTAIENWHSNNLTKFVSREDDYRALRGRHWQGIVTPNTLPDNGASVTADWTKRPTDQPESWADWFTGANALASSIPCQVRIDVYDGPKGKGWTMTVRFTKDGRTYARTWNTGPETWRDRDWADVT